MKSSFNLGILVVLALLLLVFSPTFVAGQEYQTEMEMLEIFFLQENLSEDMFTQQVLNQVSVEQLEGIREDLTGNLGDFLGAEKTGDHNYEVFFSEGRANIQFVVVEGKIGGLFFLSVTHETETLEEIFEEFKKLWGEVSLLITRNGEEIFSFNPDLELAVGSTFKIPVLKVIKDQVDTGDLSWSDVIVLEKKHISMPSGRLHTWPIGAMFTVYSLAGRMISESDNTATDMLIWKIGRKNLEKKSPQNVPFLTTREFFVLKNPDNQDLLERFREEDIDGKYEVLLEGKERALPSVNIFDRVRDLDVEWFFSVTELKEFMEEVKDLDIMTINPGPVNHLDWARVAFKGGSEPGVFNFTHYLWAEDGTEYFVSATWNDEERLDETRFVGLYQRLLGKLKD